MPAIAHEGCTDTVRESALKVCRKKSAIQGVSNPTYRGLEPASALPLAFRSDALIIIIIMYIYHALINAPSAHMIHINLNMIFYTHVEHSPTKTIHIKY